MEPFIIDVMPTEDTDFVLSSHEGEEFIMVMEGIMEISYGKNTYLLEEGDSIIMIPLFLIMYMLMRDRLQKSWQ